MSRAKPFVLVILDGFGVSAEAVGNPVAAAKKPALDGFLRDFPFTTLQASGIAVGLPWGEAGNSEVGHLTMGAGRVLHHHLPRIIHAIADGSFFENEALAAAAGHVKKNSSRLHIAGLVSSGSVHSYAEHLEALAEWASRAGVPQVFIHIFTDGKDAPPKEGRDFLPRFHERIRKEYPAVRIATVQGRFFAMDRDEKWDRVQRAYDLITRGIGADAPSLTDYLTRSYEQGINDEFIEPAVLDKEGIVRGNDAVIFFNFREDSMRELVHAFVDDGFTGFPRQKTPGLFVATMTAYEKNLAGTVPLFPTADIPHPLGKALSDAGLRQLRIAETEKYAHVTYFLNGGDEKPFPMEDRMLVPSVPVSHFDEAPEMRAREITEKILENMEAYDIVIANFANADMVGHTGNFQAGVRAVEALDTTLQSLSDEVLRREGVLLITADHGNIELKRNMLTGEARTEHSMNPVPLILVDNQYKRAAPRTDAEILAAKKEVGGILTDVAPTVLELLGLGKPQEMTGRSLLSLLLEWRL